MAAVGWQSSPVINNSHLIFNFFEDKACEESCQLMDVFTPKNCVFSHYYPKKPINCLWLQFPFFFSFFFLHWAIESLNIAVGKICPRIPRKLIHSHNRGQNPIFYLSNTSDSTDWQTFPIKWGALLQDMAASVSRTLLIAKLVRKSRRGADFKLARAMNNGRWNVRLLRQ